MRPTAPAPGYSGTPLAKKLGIKEGSQLLLIDAPPDYHDLFDAFPAGVHVNTKPGPATDLVHLFVTHKDDLARHLATLRHALGPSAMVWVSWPKKSAKVPTDVTEDTIRELALPLGFVDVKVCAVSAVWSGLKLVVRKALR
jgi:hypothetical protein